MVDDQQEVVKETKVVKDNEVVKEMEVAAPGHLVEKDVWKSKPTSWRDAAAAAGVLTFAAANDGVFHQQNGGGDIVKTKRKTPKQNRTAPMKRKLDTAKFTESEKKMFKEAFNTDKSRLEKRQTRYDRPANFLILVEDNLHQPKPGGAFTAGKMMAFGRGPIMDKFLGGGVKHNSAEYFVHANTFDFTEKEIVDDKLVLNEDN